jgi:hypothetical protein
MGNLVWNGLMGFFDWWAACEDAAADASAEAGCCMSVSLRIKTLGQNMEQCKRGGRDFKRD